MVTRLRERESKHVSRLIRILLIDEQPIVRRGFAALLREELGFMVCGEAGDACAALEILRTQQPDLVILDLALRNGGSGIDLIRNLRAQEPTLRILVASALDESLYADRALRAGAMGYVSKEESPERLLLAVRQVASGHLYLSASASDRALRRIVGRRTEDERSPLERLSDRELDVFDRIGRGLTTREIALQLRLSVKTVETHRERIKTKLDVRSSPELVAYAARWRADREALARNGGLEERNGREPRLVEPEALASSPAPVAQPE